MDSPARYDRDAGRDASRDASRDAGRRYKKFADDIGPKAASRQKDGTSWHRVNHSPPIDETRRRSGG